MNAQLSIRDAIYEEPGPKTKRNILIGTVITLILVAALIAWCVYTFYINGQLDKKYWELFTWPTTWNYMWQGLVGTFQVAFTAGVLSIILGLILMLGRISKFAVLRGICAVIINIFRGVPSLLFIYGFQFGVPSLGITLPTFWMLTLPITFAASGVLAEVFRSGVNAVPLGQTEAGLSIGLTSWKVKTKIVIPQAVRMVIPSLISQLVVVVKDTALAYVVSYPDLMQNTNVLRTNYDALVSSYLVVAVIYILINYAINQISVFVSKKSSVKTVR